MDLLGECQDSLKEKKEEERAQAFIITAQEKLAMN